MDNSLHLAIASGNKYYFTGKKCCRGHISVRYTKKRACVLCVREDSYKRSLTEKVKKQNTDYKKTKEYKEQQKEYKSTLIYKINANQNQKKRRSKNKERSLDIERKSSRKNREKRNQYCRDHYIKNKSYYKLKAKTFVVDNPLYFKARNSMRRTMQNTRKPVWFSELDVFCFEEAKDLAIHRSEFFGFEWHIDHRVPLLCKTASGLNCKDNINVIPGITNLMKGNKLTLVGDLDYLRAMTS